MVTSNANQPEQRKYMQLSRISVARMIRNVLLCAMLALFSPPAFAQGAAQSATPATNPALDQENILHLDLSTGGRVSIILFPKTAPNHVERIKKLARDGFYNGITFHRVIEGFMAQTGDPTGTGAGGSKLPDLKAEFSRSPHLRGTVSMAREGNNVDSANSQFFIVFQPKFSLDNDYTVFGRVISGMQFVDGIKRGEPPAAPDRILQASVAADQKPEPNYNAAKQPAQQTQRIPEGSPAYANAG